MVPHGWWLPETDGRELNLFGIWDIIPSAMNGLFVGD
jgi:hypothetical protein